MKRINKRTALLSSGDLLSTEDKMNIFFQISENVDIRICNITCELGLEEFEIVADTNNELLSGHGLKWLYNVDKNKSC